MAKKKYILDPLFYGQRHTMADRRIELNEGTSQADLKRLHAAGLKYVTVIEVNNERRKPTSEQSE